MADAFQTTLTLTRQPDGRYTLNALTRTPDSCRIADPAKRGAVFGQTVPSDAIAFILPTRRNQSCNDNTPGTIKHSLRDIVLPPGKTKVVAFLVINPGTALLTTATASTSGGGGGPNPPGPGTPRPPIPTKNPPKPTPTPSTPRPRVHLPFETPPWVVVRFGGRSTLGGVVLPFDLPPPWVVR